MTPMEQADDSVLSVTEPAREFPEAFLLGNGTLGATVYGRPGVEDFDINLDTVWSGGPSLSEPHHLASIQRLRQAIAEERHGDADALARGLQSDGWTQSYQPIGRVSWQWAAEARSSDYRRELHLGLAEARTINATHTLSAYVSGPDDVVVATAPRGAAPAVTFSSPHPLLREEHYQSGGVRWLVVAGRAPSQVLPNYVDAVKPISYGTERAAPGATAPAGMGWALAAAVAPQRDGSTRLLIAASSGYRGFHEHPSIDLDALVEEARDKVCRAVVASADDLRSRHRREYSAFFHRVRLDLQRSGSSDATAAQRYFDLGRYLLISSSRPGTQPANLQGIWNVDVRPGWSANYTSNINVQMNYWGAEVLGLSELHDPLLQLTADLAAAGVETARRYYDAAGAAVHHNTDIWRFSEPVHGEPQYANWQMGLAWLAAHLGDRLDYAWSNEFARDVALPVLRAASEFALAQLVADTDGSLVVSPSTSPEHRFVHQGVTGTVTAGATIDQELTHQLITRLLAVSDSLGVEEPLRDRAQAALSGLRLPGIDELGRLEEWRPRYGPSELDHRHLSHLYGAYPGARVTATANAEAFEGVRAALRSRLEHGSGYTGWSQAWVLCLAARLHDRDLAALSLSRLIGDLSSPSLLDLHPHPDWPGNIIFQIDGNLGAIAGIAELLMQSHDGAISLLPTLPPSWAGGSIRGLRARGSVGVDIEWEDHALVSATLSVERDGLHTVELDASVVPDLRAADGSAVFVTRGPAPPGRSRWAWSAAAGERYIVSPADPSSVA